MPRGVQTPPIHARGTGAAAGSRDGLRSGARGRGARRGAKGHYHGQRRERALCGGRQPGHQTVGLTGTGVAQVTVSPASLTFAVQKVGTKSAAKTVTLTNNLPTALPFGISFTGADPNDFAATNNCSSSVPAKSHCSISVTFTPGATGKRTATLNVNDSANKSPQTVSLSGTGD